MSADTGRISGYADALAVVESRVRHMLLSTETSEAKLGLEIALTAIKKSRTLVHEYAVYLCDLRERYEEEWGP